MRTLRKLLLSGLGTGYLPVAPGTWGSAAVAGLFLLIGSASPRAVCLNGSMAVLIVLSGVICVAFGRFAERAWRKKDPGRCVIDEWAGQAVALLFLPLTGPLAKLAICVALIAAARPRLCYDKSHGQPLAGGHWWTTQGYWPLLTDLRNEERDAELLYLYHLLLDR